MEIKISELILVNLTARKSEKTEKTYYNAICIVNGYPVRVSCTEAFYNAFNKKLSEQKTLTLHGVEGKIAFYKEETRVTLL